MTATTGICFAGAIPDRQAFRWWQFRRRLARFFRSMVIDWQEYD